MLVGTAGEPIEKNIGPEGSPLFPLVTVTERAPGCVSSAAGTLTLHEIGCGGAATHVVPGRAMPSHRISEMPSTSSVPLTVSVKPGDPGGTVLGVTSNR